MGNIRKGTVMATDAQGQMAVDYQDGGSGPPVPRWMFGGVKSGLHVGPAQFDQALVLGWGNRNQPAGVVPMTDHPEQLAALLPGEVLLYGPNSTVLLQANATYPFSLNGSNGSQVVADGFGNLYMKTTTNALVAIYSNGSIGLTPGAGQGVAVVSGGLTVTGGLVVTGDVHITGTLYVNGTAVTVP